MRRLILIVFLLVGFLSIGCTHAPLIKTTPVMRFLYRPYQEISFCLTKDGNIYNLIEGGYFHTPLALCKNNDIVIHTHPIYSGLWASFVDRLTWEWRRDKYGDDCFGIMKKDFYRVYCKDSKSVLDKDPQK